MVEKFLTFIFLAVLITGGYGLNTTELFLPSSGTSCTLPPLPDTRHEHTLDYPILCGGQYTGDTCVQWSPDTGTWEELLTLDVSRSGHVSWTPDNGIGTFLMGGGVEMSTTLITPDGSQEPGYHLTFTK